MGQKHGKSLTSKATKQYVAATNFNEQEVHALAAHFETISSTNLEDSVIDRNEFKQALGFKDSLFLNRLFMIFDSDGDGQINFEEFITGISMMCESGDFAEKVNFSFQVYDFDQDGRINRGELTDMLKASLSETGLMMTEDEITAVVNSTVAQVSPDGDDDITFEQYKAYATAHKARFYAAMTVNVKQRIASQLSRQNSR